MSIFTKLKITLAICIVLAAGDLISLYLLYYR